jgi:hypothetical protein
MSPKVWNRSRAGPYDSACIRSIPHVSIRPYDSASIRQHTSAGPYSRTSMHVCIRQHTSACVSVLVRTTAPVSIRQHTSASVNIRQHTSAYVSIRQLQADRELVRTTAPACTAMPAYVSIRQHTSAPAVHCVEAYFCRSLECLSMCTKRHRYVYRLKRGDFGGTDNVHTAPGTQLLRF